MPKRSAGLLMYRWRAGALEVLLVHPGGPYFAKKDHGAWTIPKGLLEEGEAPLACACREFTEETSFTPTPPFLSLGEAKQKSGKLVTAFAFEGDCDAARVKSNLFTLEWPPGSGTRREFPEVDRAEWLSLSRARAKIIQAQSVFLDALERSAPPKLS